jgi:hypothetical protein
MSALTSAYKAVRSIINDAEDRIAPLMPGIKLRIYRTSDADSDAVALAERALPVIAEALDCTMPDIVGPGRLREHVERRCVATVIFYEPPFLLSFPRIGDLLGGRGGSTANNLYDRGSGYLDIKDEHFLDLFNAASAAVNQWLSNQQPASS